MVDVSVIADTVAPVVAALDLELDLYDVEMTGSGRARVVRVLIERELGSERGGVDLDAIAAATEAISPVLDAPPLDTFLSGPYALEVSSPGLERPLRTPAHFRSAVGSTASVKIRIGDTPARRVRGVVREAGDDGFELALDGDTVERVGYGDVVQARTVFEWGPQPKRGGAAAKKTAKVSDENTAVTPRREATQREEEVVRP